VPARRLNEAIRWDNAMADASDQRKSGRRRTLFGGVVYTGGNEAWDCSIFDISELGAKVRVALDLPVGSFVDLKINKLNDIRRCKVMWVREGHLGLEFVVKIDKVKNKMTEFFKLAENQ
jgi:hypothetical protein